MHNNFLQALPGGHCFYCHKDYPDKHDFEACDKINHDNYYYPCDPRCKDSDFYNKIKLPDEYGVDKRGRLITL